MIKKRAVFIDRDGTLIEERDYLRSAAGIAFLPGAITALRLLKEKGLPVVMVSNQSGVARGYFTLEDVAQVHDALQEKLGSEGLELDALYFCPHHPEGSVEEFRLTCDCRKPAPGLLDMAARELSLDLDGSWVIGDKPCDIQLAADRPLRPLLVRTGYGADTEKQLLDPAPEKVCRNLLEAAEWIIAGEEAQE